MLDTKAELAELRAQLEGLQTQRMAVNDVTQLDTPEAASQNPPDWLEEWLDEDGKLDAEALLGDLGRVAGNWIEGFNEDLEAAKPSSILAVFALGVQPPEQFAAAGIRCTTRKFSGPIFCRRSEPSRN